MSGSSKCRNRVYLGPLAAKRQAGGQYYEDPAGQAEVAT
jgi:hypothetical protein